MVTPDFLPLPLQFSAALGCELGWELVHNSSLLYHAAGSNFVGSGIGGIVRHNGMLLCRFVLVPVIVLDYSLLRLDARVAAADDSIVVVRGASRAEPPQNSGQLQLSFTSGFLLDRWA